ncbi:MAG: methyltransferase domain-containing protein, partial [Synergistales bacterium]|nr:methyltransferase domain-containing protein [Synergistales bacterium]
KSNPRILQRAEIRGWSSACSTGEEAYTMAMVLKDSMGDRATPKVLATDVSKGSVAKAMKGEYRKDIRKDVDPLILQRYFTKAGEHYRVNQEIRRFITFRSFNLAEQFPFRDSFDIIFCRNVMIYFSPEMQQSLLNKLYRALTPGGLLFIGHSESLIGKVHRFQYIQPTVYMR